MKLPADEFRKPLPSELVEDQLALKRLKEEPTRRIFTVPVGHLSPEEARKTIEEWREKFKKMKFRN